MSRKPRLLDLFAGGGGAGVGYARAGFEVVGVDIRPQPHYPFEFWEADALSVLTRGSWREFDAIHASPPCQAYTPMSNRWRANAKATREHPKLIEPVRALLELTNLPWIIENVPGAPVRRDARLCGYTFGLGVHRHRLFESNVLLLSPKMTCRGWRDHVGVYGDHPDGGRLWDRADGHAPLRRAASVKEAQEAMGIDWMPEWSELKEAIPPAFTEYLGIQLLQALELAA